MNKKFKLLGLLGTAVICAMMAGAAISAVMSAAGLGANAAAAYLCALAGAAVCAAFGWSTAAGIIAASVGTLAAGTYIAMNVGADGSVSALVNAIKDVKSSGALDLSASSGLTAGMGGATTAAMLYALLSDHSTITTIAAIVASLGTMTIAAATGEVGVVSLVPGTLGACAAIAHTSEQRRTGGHLLALVPAALATMIALALVPAGGTTWKPLENAANKVRQLYEDYFSYTQERVAFSISEQGYDYYGLRNDVPTHMLGGPANPGKQAVMRVETTDNMLLRGTVRGMYTGYSWEDDTARARNLYYDFTRRSIRDAAFGIDELDKAMPALKKVSANVTMLENGSSTLFVPARMTQFDMSLMDAVYYNTAGEMFLARDTAAGDSYAFEAWEMADMDSVSALSREIGEDADYGDMVNAYTDLPDGIEQGVYQIADSLTEGLTTDAEKAQAIVEGLAKNCTYKLDVDYPPTDRDFVSYFLLDTREGYCSYFATAMAVLCRIEGIPARFAEGYRVYAENGGVTNITGEDAHAWVEVYIKGMGWIAYDPTPGDGTGDAGEANVDPRQTPEPTEEPASEQTPEPTHDGDDFGPTETPVESTPTPKAGEDNPTPPPQSPQDDPTAEPEPDGSEDTPDKNGGKWLWWLLIAAAVLAALAGAWLALKKRLEKTDPVRLAAAEKDGDRSVMILYRSLLTLLMLLGQTPLNGETPEAFAKRLNASGLDNEDFEGFAAAITVSRYSGKKATKEMTSLGARAYLRFRRQMKKGERLKFDTYRVLHGLGNFEQIP